MLPPDDSQEDYSASGSQSNMSSPSRRQAWKQEGARANSNFKVVIRTRPPLAREMHGDRPFQNIVAVDRVSFFFVSCVFLRRTYQDSLTLINFPFSFFFHLFPIFGIYTYDKDTVDFSLSIYFE